MHKVTYAAAAIAFAGFLTTVPAQAEYGVGGVQKKGNQCFVAAITQGRDGFGHWEACPQHASSPSATAANAHHVRHPRTQAAQ